MLFDISEHFISVRFPFNKEAVSILDEQTNGGVSGGVSGGVDKSDMNLSNNARLVLQIIKQDGTLTQKEIAEQSLLSTRSVQRAMKELRDNGVIAREGSDKNGRYIATGML
jgi:ATP-dependent DNA helicase RecG